MFDVIVVGLGAAGAATLHELAKRGARAMGIDRFTAPNDRASHHGESRIIRMAYAEHPSYVPLLGGAYTGWQALEQEAGIRLLHVTGSVHGGLPNGEEFTGAVKAAREHGLDYEILDARALEARFPAFQLPDNYRFVYQPQGGFIASEAAIGAYIAGAKARGSVVLENAPVDSWSSVDNHFVVDTSAGQFRAHSLVLAAGAWLPRLVPELAPSLWIERQPVGWFDTQSSRHFAFGHFPVFTIDTELGQIFGFPEWQRPGFKIGIHHHLHEEVDPDDFERQMNARDEEILRSHVRFAFPSADGPLLNSSAGVYTMTPDEFFLFDLHPRYRRVALASPCSGHGFKFSPVIGQIMADLVLTGVTDWDISQHRLSRFEGFSA